MIYSALEDFRMDILIGTGPGARTVAMDIKRFTAIGATTRQGLISAPLRGRFGLVLRLNHYDMADLARHRAPLGAAAGRRNRRSRARRKSPAAAAERRASPTVCCGASAITLRCAPAGHIELEVARRALDLLEVDPLRPG